AHLDRQPSGPATRHPGSRLRVRAPLTVHAGREFEPSLSHGGDIPQTFLAGSSVPGLRRRGEKAMADSLARGMPRGYEVGYRAFTVNGRKLGHSQPIKVRTGERVLFHVLNASATEIRSLALPGHTFEVVALDGNPVPRKASVPSAPPNASRPSWK
ncbi:hypothetical protein ACIBJF_48110, partial [Streptomyces sp. NPDC050743]